MPLTDLLGGDGKVSPTATEAARLSNQLGDDEPDIVLRLMKSLPKRRRAAK
ncbi:MAG TPA: hypothetical protein VM580_07385 [Labilithrix sp.]|nr:hypothetical protein [Labilithrix sp.]